MGWGQVDEIGTTLDVSRRQLLRGLGIGGLAIVALPLSMRAAGAAATTSTTTIWRLNAEWGYPAGPKNWTRCRCSTCHSHAANKVYRTEAAAIAGRLHPCCVCQTESITTSGAGAAALFAFARPADPDSVDLRWAGVSDAFATIDTVDDSPDPGTARSGDGSAGSTGAAGSPAARPGRAVPVQGSTLPRTGSDLGELTVWGALLAAAGSALWFRARESHAEPPDSGG